MEEGEHLTIEICGDISIARQQVIELQCRVDGFSKQARRPALPDLDRIKAACSEAGKVPQADASRPAVSHSEQVGDMLSENSGILGWLAVTVEYAIKHYFVVRMASATLLLMGGLMMAAFGYRYKDCEFWIEGFLAGLVVWPVLFSVMIAYFGVCRGRWIDTCEPKVMLMLVVALSSVCACVTVKVQAAQEFLAGFDLGAMVGVFVFWPSIMKKSSTHSSMSRTQSPS